LLVEENERRVEGSTLRVVVGSVMSSLYLYSLLYPFSSGNFEQPGAEALRRLKAELALQIDPRLIALKTVQAELKAAGLAGERDHSL
jgi:hypothetical protein